MSIKLGDALVYLGAKNDGLKKDLDKANQMTSGWVSAVSAGVGIALGGALVNAVGKGITAVGNLGKSVFDFSYQGKQAVLDFQSELGATAEEAQILGQIVKSVWRNNFGKDVADAAGAVGIVRQQLRRLNEEGIQLASQSALAIRDAYGVKIPKAVDAARTLMEDFNLTNQQAWDFIAAGYQRGLDRSGDFLESITEYGPQFNAAKVGAGQFFSVMETGLQGGMLGTDRALDMFKEFRVRLLDGSKSTAEGLALIGLSVDEVTARINDGTLSWDQAFQLVNGRLRETDDQAVQIQAGAALLGTQFEDLGTQAALGVNMANTSMEDLAGSADKLNTRYNNLGDFMQGMGRRMTVALSLAADAILQLANDALPSLETAFQRIEAGAGDFAVGFVAILQAMVNIAHTFFRSFRKTAGDEMGETAVQSETWGRNIVLFLARGMAQAMTAVVKVINSIASLIAGWFKPHSPPKVAKGIDKWGAGMIEAWIDGALSADVGRLGGIGDRIQSILGTVGSSAALGIFGKASSAITSLFQSLPGRDEDTSIVGKIVGSRTAIAAAVAEIQNLGAVSTGTYQAVLDTLAPLPDAARAYVSALFEVQQAETAVAKAQEELTRVTQKYDAQLSPLREELNDLKDQEANIADEKRIAALRQAIARGALNEEQKQQALKEIRQRELALQIRTLEDEKETAVDAAQQKLDAAEAEKNAAEEQLAIQEALLKAGQEHNDLINRQLGLLDSLAGAMTGVGDALGLAMSDALGAGTGDLDNMLAGLDAGFNPEEMADGLQTSLEEAMSELDIEGIMEDVAAEFAPLQTEVGNMGETFSNLTESWDGFLQRLGLVDENGQSTLDWLGALGDLLVIVGGALLGIKAAGLITGLVTGLAGLAGVTGGASGAMATFTAIIGALGGPVVWLIGIIGALAAAWTTDFMGMRTTLTGLWDLVVIIFQLIWERIIEWDQNVSATLEAWSHRVSATFEQLKFIIKFTLATILLNASQWATRLVTRIQTAVTQLVAIVSLKFNEIKTAVTNLKQRFNERLQSMMDTLGKTKDFVFGLWDAIKGFWEWLKGKVFNFNINLPDLPEWAIPGSPIPLHTAWKNFAEDMNNTIIKPGFDLPEYGNVAVPVAEGGTGSGSAVPAQIHIENINLEDASAVEAFTEWLQGAGDDSDLDGNMLEFREV